MNLLKKVIPFLFIFALTAGVGGCANAKTASSSSSSSSSSSQQSSSSEITVQTTGGFTLPYTSVPAFNPLLPGSALNEALWPLIYDCVSEPDPSYKPVMQLASSVTSSGTAVSIQLRSGLSFSDNSSLTGDDVKYTYDYVKSHPQSPYSSRLSNVTSVSADGMTVTLTLKNPDPLIANLLDIPIIKSGSDVGGNAIGSGKYIYSKNGVNATLTLNKNWYKGVASAYNTIPLENIPDQTAVMNTLAIGDVNYVYSDSGAGPATTPVNTETASVNLNQLVFVGINSAKSRLNNAHFRRALSLSVDRNLLISQTFSNRAEASVLPFNPSFSEITKPAKTDLTADYNKAASEMTLAGGTGGAGTSALTLLVNKENSVRVAAAKFVAGCFSKAGVNVTVSAVPFSDYKKRISQGNFDLYIGEIKLSNDMDLSPLLAPGGSVSKGVPSNSSSYTAFQKWRSGTAALKEAESAFTDEMPFLPLCYRLGTTTYTRGIQGVTAMDGDIFFDFENWKAK